MRKETKAQLRYLRMSPQKVRLLVDLVRGLKVEPAKAQLALSAKHAARPVLKLLNSAIANAKHNDFLQEDTLVIKSAFVDGGPVLKRWTPKAHGSATPIHKRTSHITIVLEGEVDEKAAQKIQKTKKADKIGAESKAKETDNAEEKNTSDTDKSKVLEKKATKTATKAKKVSTKKISDK